MYEMAIHTWHVSTTSCYNVQLYEYRIEHYSPGPDVNFFFQELIVHTLNSVDKLIGMEIYRRFTPKVRQARPCSWLPPCAKPDATTLEFVRPLQTPRSLHFCLVDTRNRPGSVVIESELGSFRQQAAEARGTRLRKSQYGITRGFPAHHVDLPPWKGSAG